MAGLTTAGLTIKRAAEIVAELKSALRQPTALGPAASVRDSGPLGQIIGTFATQLAKLWEIAQDLYDSFDPDVAQGEALDNICAFSLVTRRSATKTSGFLTLVGDPGTVIPAGSLVSIGSDGAQFSLISDATITSVGTISAEFQAVESGAIEASAAAIDTIVTPIFGWDSITHSLDFITGDDLETDAELRLRRESSLGFSNAGTDGAIRQALLDGVAGIQDARVFSNRRFDPVDAFNTPLNQFQAFVWPNTVNIDEVVTVLYENTPAGIQSYGSVVRNVVDNQGWLQQFAFSIASQVGLHFDIILTTDSDYPVDGDDQVKAAVNAFVDTLGVNDDLLVHEVAAAIERGVPGDDSDTGVPGILTIEVRVLEGSAPGASDTDNIEVDPNQIVTTSLGDIDVNGA